MRSLRRYSISAHPYHERFQLTGTLLSPEITTHLRARIVTHRRAVLVPVQRCVEMLEGESHLATGDHSATIMTALLLLLAVMTSVRR